MEIDTRLKRRLLKKEISESNPVGHRISWTRDKLKLRLTDVCSATNIPPASFSDREAGVRTSFYEELFILAAFFERKWQEKYGKFQSYPTYKGKEIKEISVMWVIFGDNSVQDTYDQLLENIAQDFKSRMHDMEKENEDLRNQLNMEDFINNQELKDTKE